MSANNPNAPSQIELKSVSKSFDDGARYAARDVSLSVAKGEFVAIVGASGSGKTTILKSINRLIEVEGEVRVEGEAVTTIEPSALRRRIGYVFQGIGLFPHMSVGENIAITPQLLGWSATDIAARVAELLDLVELPRDYAGRAPSALSGGERQRVGVARALAARPRIVLMDEPFGALDPVTRHALAGSYRALHDELGLTTLMVTHDVQEAVLMASRIVVMGRGRVLADGTPSTLLAGHADPDVAALMAMPRVQAERIRTLVEPDGPPRHG